MPLTPLTLERGTYNLPPAGMNYQRLAVYAPQLRAADAGADLDGAMSVARTSFERAMEELRASSRWADVHQESGRTAGYRFEYIVLRAREATADDEAIVGAVMVAPADPAATTTRFQVTADVSGEETGTIHFEARPHEAPRDGLREAVAGGAEAVLRWLQQGAPEARG
jgi:hypothetical protein